MTGVCHFSNLRHVCSDSFHALQSPGVSEVEMNMRDRCKQPRSQGSLLPALRSERERDPVKHWSRVSQNLGDYKQTIWGRDRQVWDLSLQSIYKVVFIPKGTRFELPFLFCGGHFRKQMYSICMCFQDYYQCRLCCLFCLCLCYFISCCLPCRVDI